MNITQLTTDQVSSLGNDELADVRDRPAYKATVVENRNVISDEEHRTALHLRALHYAAEDDIEIRQKQPEHKQGGPPPSLEGFIAFSGLSPPDKAYNWVDCYTCLVAAYASSPGLDYATVSRTPIPTPTD